MSEPIEKITLHVPRSTDGRTEFARIADVLDYLATTYGWHPDAYGFLVTRAYEARCIDSVHENTERREMGFTLQDVQDHIKANPRGCEFGRGCDVCVAAGILSPT